MNGPGKCWAAGIFGTECDTPWQRAHLGFRKSDLKHRMGLEREMWDPRIWRWVCWKHHQLLDGPNFHLWKHQLPTSVLDFAQEKGIEHVLDEADRKYADHD